ncbi:Hpr(Ser) kinase/phosphatase [Tistrella mobilis]|uniref:Hpr(Ser) kinase/phosphatase n=1 Tax=Tistrella mobilis (strain KA081020-065) TaxID=1110502 RepID=I3TT62_TISMK|nr:Hpr(Ser) kinase/phosphatase [Tistrella mobilis]AFK55950.1 Hpr(Ser) kinase/phosphatase [Tistrella mobilis KA081020-065]
MPASSTPPITSCPDLPDVDIRRVEALPDHLAGAVPVNGFVEATADRLLVRMPGIGRFLAEEGRRLLIAGEAGASDADLDYFAVRTPLAGLIHQRGELPLHAACLLPPGGKAAVAISGASGAGKSTLAAMLLGRGWRFVADEVVRVTLDGRGRPLAWPGTPIVALWPDAARMLGITPTELPMARPQHGRVLHQAMPMSGPVALGHVVLLDLHRAGDTDVLSGVDRLETLAAEVFRPRQVRAMGRQAAHMAMMTRLAAQLQVWRVGVAHRPSPDELCDRLAARVAEAGR